MMMRRLLLASLAFGALAVPAAEAAPFVIKATGSKTARGKVKAIGDFRPERDPSLSAATSAFGAPTNVSRTSSSSCRGLWSPVGVRILFVNLGGGGPCAAALTKSQVVRAFDTRWRTGRGLGVGDRLRRLRRIYPGATRHGRSWWLVTGRNVFVGGRLYPVLRATLKNGRVSSFALDVGAGGE